MNMLTAPPGHIESGAVRTITAPNPATHPSSRLTVTAGSPRLIRATTSAASENSAVRSPRCRAPRRGSESCGRTNKTNVKASSPRNARTSCCSRAIARGSAVVGEAAPRRGFRGDGACRGGSSTARDHPEKARRSIGSVSSDAATERLRALCGALPVPFRTLKKHFLSAGGHFHIWRVSRNTNSPATAA